MRDGIEVDLLLMCCGKAVYRKKITVLHFAELRLLPEVWAYRVAIGTGCPRRLWMPHPCRHSRPGWMWLWAAWAAGW